MAILNASVTTTASPIFVSSGNTAVSTVQANIYLAPSTGNVANSTTVIYGNVTISAYDTLIIYQEKFLLGAGDTIYANVSAANSVTATVSSLGF